VQRDAGQVERLEQVGVAELGGQRHSEHVELDDRPVPVDGELRDAALPHEPGEVRPDGVRALSQYPVAFVQDLVEDLYALVGQPNLVRVGVHQRPAHLGGVPVLDRGVELPAHVLDRLLHPCQQWLEAPKQRCTSHAAASRAERTAQPNPQPEGRSPPRAGHP
jgi:hypothetical protein